MDKIKHIASNFNFDGKLIEIKENTQGNINKTYVLVYDDNGDIKKYLLQKINSTVFKEPYLVMKNIELVTDYLQRKLRCAQDNDHQTLTIIKANDGENLYTYVNDSGEKEYYRAFNYIGHDNRSAYDRSLQVRLYYKNKR